MDTNNTNGTSYSSYYGQNQQPASKPPKKNNSTFKKVMTGALCGIVFGIFTGVGFVAVSHFTDILKVATPFGRVVEAIEEKEDAGIAMAPVIESTPAPSVNEDVDSTEEVTKEAEKKAQARENIKQTELTGTAAMLDVTDVVEAVMPSVVIVNNKYTARANYFGQIYQQEATSTGSGIIVGENDSELLIVTNYHVVEGEDELSVVFADEQEIVAQVKGTDEDRDLAVIAVQLDDISDSTRSAICIANMGDSDTLEVGEPVIAIGNALGYGQSVTTGVVSALNRTIASDSSTYTKDGELIEPDEDTPVFIQTDAAINPGNSGGALLNARGEVIGINSNKIGGTAIEGIGYAIPISDAKPIISDLMSKETKLKVAEDNRGIIGITGVNVEKEYSEIYGIPVGVYVSSVTEGSGADDAGLVKGDIIVGINGEEITTMDELKKQLEYYAQGTEVTLTIMQGSPTGYVSKDVAVVLGAANSQ